MNLLKNVKKYTFLRWGYDDAHGRIFVPVQVFK